LIGRVAAVKKAMKKKVFVLPGGYCMKGLCQKGISILTTLVILAVSLLAAGCNLLPIEEEQLAPPLMKPAKIEYKTKAIERGTLIMQLQLFGSFYSKTQESLSFEQQGGRVKAIHAKLGQIVKTGDLIAELDSASLEIQIQLQEIEVEKANLAITQLRANRADSYSVKRAKLDLEQQQIRLQELQRQLDATRIFAPIDGEVVYVISLSIGEYVNAYQLVAKIANRKELILVSTYDKAGTMPIGSIVDVEFEKTKLVGEVTDNASTLYNNADENLHEAAIITIQGTLPAAVVMGSSARIIFVQDKRENVLILPRTQVNQMNGRRYVNVLEDGVRVEKDVEVGLTTDTEIEIVSGLIEGDLVIIN
jgi:membrane fusion protein, macrolide-specific efflux system